MIQLMLLMRQEMVKEGHIGVSLSDKEAIDKSNWEDLLKSNRQKFNKY